jgi:hypothetical protein
MILASFSTGDDKQHADLLEEVFIAEKGASFPSVFVDVENRRSEDGEKDNAKFLALITLLMAANQPPENPALQAIPRGRRRDLSPAYAQFL